MVLRLYDEIKIKQVEFNRGCYYFFIMKKKVVIVMVIMDYIIVKEI